jgi:hypothetical protein
MGYYRPPEPRLFSPLRALLAALALLAAVILARL